MKVKYYKVDTSLMKSTGNFNMIVYYKFENNKWYNRFPDERDWRQCNDPHENKWPHEKVKKITKAEAFLGLI